VTPPLLAVHDLAVHFATRAGTVRAVAGVTFAMAPGETVGLVGESGCGKTTLGRAIVGLVPAAGGSVELEGHELVGLDRAAMRVHRPRLQMIFQDPYASLNPRLTVGRIIEEPLLVHRRGTRVERRTEVARLMERVGLHPDWARRHPHEFSGGQRQRVAIARALALNPRLVICDEPVSALDVSVQAQVINLLVDLQQERGLSYLFVSHDLSVVQHIADRVMVMYLGSLVEVADREAFWSLPLHPYTRALLDAVPLPEWRPTARPPRQLLQSEMPSPLHPPSGCRFRTRCPYATDMCAAVEPPLKPLAGGRLVACHYIEEEAGSLVYPGARVSASP
jgi:oligopeptide/dipeptide ABC transporter ATP-binding protein